jgi:integrase
MAAKKRREKGTGSITQTADGKFRAYITLPEPDGTPKQHSQRFDTYAKADEWLMSKIRQHRGGERKAPAKLSEMTFREFLHVWLYAKKDEQETSGKPNQKTLYDYNSLIRLYVAPQMGSLELGRITSDDIEDWKLSVVRSHSERTKSPLSPQRKHTLSQMLWQVFKHAVNKGFIESNPTAGVKGFPAVTTNPRDKVLDKNDHDAFLEFITEKGCNHSQGYCELRWKVALWLGRRQGEVLGLSWNYVDLDREFIQIEQQLQSSPWKHGCPEDTVTGQPTCGKSQGQYCPQRWGGGLWLKTGTKGGPSNKPQVPIGGLVPLFINHRLAQQEERAKAKRERTYDPGDPSFESLVFTQPRTQRPYGATMDTDNFNAILKGAGIKKKYSIHDLRHTAATRLANSTGGDLPIIKDILGHKSIHTSMLYIAPDLPSRQNALDSVINPGGNRNRKPPKAKPKKNQNEPEDAA